MEFAQAIADPRFMSFGVGGGYAASLAETLWKKRFGTYFPEEVEFSDYERELLRKWTKLGKDESGDFRAVLDVYPRFRLCPVISS